MACSVAWSTPQHLNSQWASEQGTCYLAAAGSRAHLQVCNTAVIDCCLLTTYCDWLLSTQFRNYEKHSTTSNFSSWIQGLSVIRTVMLHMHAQTWICVCPLWPRSEYTAEWTAAGSAYRAQYCVCIRYIHPTTGQCSNQRNLQYRIQSTYMYMQIYVHRLNLFATCYTKCLYQYFHVTDIARAPQLVHITLMRSSMMAHMHRPSKLHTWMHSGYVSFDQAKCTGREIA